MATDRGSERREDRVTGSGVALDPASSSHAIQLPSRKSYFVTVSSIAFAAGVGFGVVFAIRQSRRIRLQDAQAVRDAAQGRLTTAASMPAATWKGKASGRVAPPTAAESSAGEAGTSRSHASLGPFALFREMNKAAFNQIARRQTGDDSGQASVGTEDANAPLILRRRGPMREASPDKLSSAFDAPLSSTAPSVLMRTPKASQARPADRSQADAEPEGATQRLNEEDEIPLGQQPAILGAKALGIATLIVGVVAIIGVEVAYRVLQVKNLDELIDRLGNIIPASERTSESFSPFGTAARKALQGMFGEPDADVNIVDAQNDARHNVNVTDEAEFSETLDQLDQAVERGDTVGWFEVLSKRLNAERSHDLAERRKRIEQANEADSARSMYQ